MDCKMSQKDQAISPAGAPLQACINCIHNERTDGVQVRCDLLGNYTLSDDRCYSFVASKHPGIGWRQLRLLRRIGAAGLINSHKELSGLSRPLEDAGYIEVVREPRPGRKTLWAIRTTNLGYQVIRETEEAA